jgi:ubiquitin conjugation factor E4 B
VNRAFFIRFVNLLLNDATFVLDEALGKFPKIHNIQGELKNRVDLPQQDRAKLEEELQGLESTATSYMQLANETLAMMKLFTAALVESFTMPEIVQRLASMLDYNLDTLAGPKMNQLLVENPQKYHFQPKVLLSDFVSIYLNLSKSRAFIEAVAVDGRSYKPATFDKAGDVLARLGLKSQAELQDWATFKVRVKEAKELAEQAELDLGDIPPEFEDPIMGDLMKDPVVLPSKHIVDRSTIVQHLLSDPKDPFTRQPMTIEDAIPADDLRHKIESWREERIAASKEKLKGEPMDMAEE